MPCRKCSERQAVCVLQLRGPSTAADASADWPLCAICESLITALLENRAVYQRGTRPEPLIDAANDDNNAGPACPRCQGETIIHETPTADRRLRARVTYVCQSCDGESFPAPP